MRRLHAAVPACALLALLTPAARAQAPAPTLEELAAELERVKAALAEQKLASEAERMALLDMMTSAQTPQLEEPKLQIYGFMDTGFQRWIFTDDETDRGAFPTEQGTFISGNTNLYFDARPAQGWRGLVETRLSLLPHGSYEYVRLGPAPRVNNRIYDLTSPSGRDRVQWGSIIMERAQIEWTWESRLRVIAGYFLTPWGIWNIEHGTPTLISLMLPSFQVEDAVPQHLTGVQILGSFVAPPWELGYYAHVSNGRTSTLFDLTDDKAVGGRLYGRFAGEDFTVTLGSSGFWGRSEDESKSITADPNFAFALEKTLIFRSEEWAAGGDVSLDWGGLRVRSEALVRHVSYRRGAREPTYGVYQGFIPDHFEHFGYVTVAYRLGAFEPYAYVEGKTTEAQNGFLPDDARAFSGGLNIYFSASTQLKLQYADVYFENRNGKARPKLVVSRLVLAF